MALKNLQGYWKYGDAVVPFRIEPVKLPIRNPAFVPRKARLVSESLPLNQLPIETPTVANGNGHHHKHETEIEIDLTTDQDDLDIKF